MLGKFTRGTILDLAIIYVSNVNFELIDPINPTVEISHYIGNDEIIDLPEMPVVKIATRPVGYYTLEYTIPNTFILNEMYYVRWRGTDPNCLSSRDVSEEQFIVIDGTSGGTGAGCCLVPRFSNC